MFLGTRKDIEKILRKSGKVDKKTAKRFEDQATAIAVTDAVTGVGMKAATPIVAGAAGLGAAATVGTAALAAAFPIGTLIVAVPIVVSLGFSVAKGESEKNAAALTKDQQELVKKIKKFKKRKSSWRIKKAKRWIKDYAKHLDKGRKKTIAPWDGNKREKHEPGWKARRARLEMDLTAIYMAEYKTTPPKRTTKKEQRKTRSLIKTIQNKQKKSNTPTSAFKISGRKLLLDKPLLQRQTTRMLQRPSEMTSVMNQRPLPAPQSIAKTIQESPGVLDDTIDMAKGEDSTGLLKIIAATGVVGLGLLGSFIL